MELVANCFTGCVRIVQGSQVAVLNFRLLLLFLAKTASDYSNGYTIGPAVLLPATYLRNYANTIYQCLIAVLKSTRSERLKSTLEIVLANNWITGVAADLVDRQFNSGGIAIADSLRDGHRTSQITKHVRSGDHAVHGEGSAPPEENDLALHASSLLRPRTSSVKWECVSREGSSGSEDENSEDDSDSRDPVGYRCQHCYINCNY
uniref:Uncharacterized protein n=1 Tax=Timema poppense TaxID=170557 RepID=A0A7R9DFI4_TIMPO|nr:unnamed protein product [Timema poppensis]